MFKKIVALAAAAAVLAAQQEDSVTFKASSNLVVVNVFVKDRAGAPMKGLKKSDFTILENGVPQTISVFDMQALTLERVAPAVAPGSAVTAETPKPPTVEERTEGSQRFKDKRLMVLFFDFAGMPPLDQVRAQDAALKFLNEQLTESDLVQVMTFSSSVRVEQEFTADRAKLIAAIKKFRIGEGTLTDLGQSLSAETTETAAATTDDAELDLFNTDRKLAALETTAKMLAPLPEKKALIYFSSGSGQTGAENYSQVRATINAAVRANVAYYPVDVRGLIATPPGGDASQAGGGGTGLYTGQAQRQQRDRQSGEQETLFALAADTGGKALIDNNDLTMGIRQAQQDIQSYYTVGYYSSNPSTDGRFRKIEVKLAANLQAKLDYRQGYYAEKEFKAFNSGDRERQLQEALLLGDPQTDLPVVLQVNYFRLNPTKYFVPIAVKIPGSALPLDQVTAAKPLNTQFDFIGQVRDARGRIAGSVRDEIKIKLQASEVAELSKRSVLYDTGFTLPPGEYRVKFLIRENLSGKMGTFETRFTIPEAPVISSVVWAAQREPVAAAIGAAEKAKKKTIENHPLIQDGQKLVPNVTRVFRANQKAFVYLETYDSQLDTQKSPSVAASVSFYRGGVKVFDSEPVRARRVHASREGAVALQFQIPIDGLKPGRYVTQVNVVDEVGKRFAYNRSPVIVLP